MASWMMVAALLGGAPDWVSSGGRSARFPVEQFLTGIGMQAGDDAVEGAKRQAVADLGRQIEVRVQSDARDYAKESNGVLTQSVAVSTRVTSDLRLSGVRYEVHREGAKTYALAILDRQEGIRARLRDLDQAHTDLRACIATADRLAEAKNVGAAIESFFRCRAKASDALGHLGTAKALGATKQDGVARELAQEIEHIDERIEALLNQPVREFGDVSRVLASQLSRQGVRGRYAVAPLTYGTTEFSSEFGAQVATDLNHELAAAGQSGAEIQSTGEVAIQGLYVQRGGLIEIRLWAASTSAGNVVATAHVRFPRETLPAELPLLPRNLQEALEEQRLLGAGELVSSALRLELWTNKGRRNLVFEEGEEVKLYLRVNKPAYVRLVYLLEDGSKALLEQAWYIDASKVNLGVEFPATFVVSPPLGIEQVHAVAFTTKPPPLAVASKLVGGETYDVVVEGTEGMVRHRGLKRKVGTSEVSEALVSLTTTTRRKGEAR